MQIFFTFVFTFILVFSTPLAAQENTPKKLAYITSDLEIPFWKIMSKGVAGEAQSLGYEVHLYSAANSPKKELQNMIDAIDKKVDGIILSPTTSSASVTLLKFAKKASIPVVIADIGSDSKDYVSFISSDNFTGAYELGKILGHEMQQKGWQNERVGIIAIPQKRDNGKARTKGFLEALNEFGVDKADIRQQIDFSYQETYNYSQQLMKQHADLRAIWLQGSDRYQAALDAIKDAGKIDEIILICFDAEPSFLELIPKDILIGSAMQQPFLIGQKAVTSMHAYLQGLPVEKQIQLPILAISKNNLAENITTIKRNVLGLVE